jgi:hypothetical protein
LLRTEVSIYILIPFKNFKQMIRIASEPFALHAPLRDLPMFAKSSLCRGACTLHDDVTVEIHESAPKVWQQLRGAYLDVLECQGGQSVELICHPVQLGRLDPLPVEQLP